MALNSSICVSGQYMAMSTAASVYISLFDGQTYYFSNAIRILLKRFACHLGCGWYNVLVTCFALNNALRASNIFLINHFWLFSFSQ